MFLIVVAAVAVGAPLNCQPILSGATTLHPPADLDGDGLVDLLLTNAGAYQVSRGNSTSFDVPVPIVAGAGSAVAPADVDGDGRLDLLFARAGQILVSWNLGGLAFSMPEVVTSATTITPPRVIDGAGRDEVVFGVSSDYDFSQRLLRLSFDGQTWSEDFLAEFGVFEEIDSVISIDVDADGDRDVAVLTKDHFWYSDWYDPESTVWAVRDEWGTVTSRPIGRVPTTSRGTLVSADLNGDGLQDLVFSLNGIRGWLRADGASGFSAPRWTEVYEGAFPSQMHQGVDLNGDGRDDLLASANEGGYPDQVGVLKVRLSKDGGSNWLSGELPTTVSAVHATDVDHDGLNDFVYAGVELGWCRNPQS